MNKEMLHKELDLIQGCIKRMASNSFLLKGWYVSLVFLGVTIFNSKDANPFIACFANILMTIVFWYLDAFFLKTETLYRWKYEWVIKERLKGNTLFYYDLNPYNANMWINQNQKVNKTDLLGYAFSKTLWPFYSWGVLIPVIYFVIKLGLLCKCGV